MTRVLFGRWLFGLRLRGPGLQTVPGGVFGSSLLLFTFGHKQCFICGVSPISVSVMRSFPQEPRAVANHAAKPVPRFLT